ncbi:MAG: hypothetical protein KAW12_15860 [Candidatus Aminicenantes bacterium]|nr:hypothetical protein [Candidatus Aminicenantes bacterium]
MVKLRKAVLSDLIKRAARVSGKESGTSGIERIGVSLKNFLHEVIVYLRQEGMLKYFLPEIPGIGEISREVEAVEQKRSKLRIRTVGSIYREGRYVMVGDKTVQKRADWSSAAGCEKRFSYLSMDGEFFKKEYTRVPRIRMTGKWLADYGFEPGKKYAVYPGDRQLILREVGLCLKDGPLEPRR